MQVWKWGNSLAVRLPAAIVEMPDLKEGDDIDIEIAGRRQFSVSRDSLRAEALERLRALQKPLPSGFRFSRRAAHER